MTTWSMSRKSAATNYSNTNERFGAIKIPNDTDVEQFRITAWRIQKWPV